MPYAAVVRLNHGRWIAACPRPGCLNAERFGTDDRGNQGGLAGSFRCRSEEGGCGLVCDALWPDNVEDIEWLVMCRPVPATRNWEPGEELDDLLAENIAHGLFPVGPAGLAGTPAGRLLAISDGKLSGPATEGRRITGRRRELGATPAGR